MVTGDDSLHVQKNEHLIPLLSSVCRFCCANIKSVQEDELFKIWVGLFMI